MVVICNLKKRKKLARNISLAIPSFDGLGKTAARSWVQKLETYLSLNPMLEEDAIKFAILHRWHHGLITQNHQDIKTYDAFTKLLIERFDQTHPQKHFKELTRIRQRGILEEYITEFQRLAVMVPEISEERLTYLFIEGLSDSLHGLVSAFDPTTLKEAIRKATCLNTKTRERERGHSKRDDKTLMKKDGHKKPYLSYNDCEELRRKGLCFDCKKESGRGHICGQDEKVCSKCKGVWKPRHKCYKCKEEWEPGHICGRKRSQAHNIEATSTQGARNENKDGPNKRIRYEEENEEGGTLVSISKASKHHPFIIRGIIKGKKVTTLVDSGATHNFIDENLAAKLRLEAKDFKGLKVALADGFTTPRTEKISQLNITMGRHQIKDKFYVVKLGDIDVILGTQWLHSLGDVNINFQKLEISFEQNGERVLLQGLSNGSPRVVLAKKMEKILRHNQVEWVAQCLILDKTTPKGKSIHVDIQPLLKKHKKVFSDIPPGLPPKRGFEHSIELEEGSKPMVTTPYCHPHKYKEEIEKTIKELLELGHIQPSSSPFASSVVLSKKKDGTMRMCIDYRALNKKTIKNRYPIPQVDELIDELHGAVYFSKIDLKSRYHQIKLREDDIPKIAFRCHYGRFEFLILPFGLTNAPTTFQSCMSHIFRGQLRKFLLVFFDYILIYSKTWEEHLKHVDEVLEIIEQ